MNDAIAGVPAQHVPRLKRLTSVFDLYKFFIYQSDERRKRDSLGGFRLRRLVGIPDDWKPFDDVGTGTREIRIREASGIYQVMYVAKFEEAVYVLHCFQKKTQATSKQDKGIVEARYRAAVNARKAQK